MPPHIRHVIFDRDGVLNIERGDGGAIRGWSQRRWIAGACIREVPDVRIHAIAEALEEHLRRRVGP